MAKNAAASPGPEVCVPTFWNKDFLFGISGFFCLYMAISLFFLLPVYLKPFGPRQSQVGLIMGIFSIVAIAVRPLFGRMIDVRGGKLLAVSGVGQGLIYPALSTYIIDFMGRDNKGLAISMYNSLFDVGMGIGAPFFGGIADLMGYRWMYVFAGIFLLAATGVFMWRAPLTEKLAIGEVPYVSG